MKLLFRGYDLSGAIISVTVRWQMTATTSNHMAIKSHDWWHIRRDYTFNSSNIEIAITMVASDTETIAATNCKSALWIVYGCFSATISVIAALVLLLPCQSLPGNGYATRSIRVPNKVVTRSVQSFINASLQVEFFITHFIQNLLIRSLWITLLTIITS